MSNTFVIVGAGHSAGQAVAALRQADFAGRVTLIGEEPHVPYQRPPLSKAFLAGTMPLEHIYLRPAKFYRDSEVELLLGERAEAIVADERCVILSGGKTVRYDKLLLTTGSRPRRLDLPGVNLPGVCYLRTIADAVRIRDLMKAASKMVVVGGGYIGLEVAAVASQAGIRVTVLEAAERVLGRVTAPEMSDFFAQLHREHGVEIQCNVRITGFEGVNKISVVVCENGQFEADIVVIGIGIFPNVALAQSAGLECDNGIVVDEYGTTTDEAIFAAGDCTNHPNSLLQRRLRLESVHNAVAQGRHAARNMYGLREPYAEIPWFWSDQYDMKLQVVGISDGYDQLVQRRSTQARSFTLLYLREGILIAADVVNNPREYMACKRLVPRQLRVAPARLADTRIRLQDMA